MAVSIVSKCLSGMRLASVNICLQRSLHVLFTPNTVSCRRSKLESLYSSTPGKRKSGLHYFASGHAFNASLLLR